MDVNLECRQPRGSYSSREMSIKATSPQRSNFIVHVQTSQETVENSVKLNIECQGYFVKFPFMSFATILSITMYINYCLILTHNLHYETLFGQRSTITRDWESYWNYLNKSIRIHKVVIIARSTSSTISETKSLKHRSKQWSSNSTVINESDIYHLTSMIFALKIQKY